MIEYREDMIPVGFIEMIAAGSKFDFASIALTALISTWLVNGREWMEREERTNYDA